MQLLHANPEDPRPDPRHIEHGILLIPPPLQFRQVVSLGTLRSGLENPEGFCLVAVSLDEKLDFDLGWTEDG